MKGEKFSLGQSVNLFPVEITVNELLTPVPWNGTSTEADYSVYPKTLREAIEALRP